MHFELGSSLAQGIPAVVDSAGGMSIVGGHLGGPFFIASVPVKPSNRPHGILRGDALLKW
jgi:hypothetical protein